MSKINEKKSFFPCWEIVKNRRFRIGKLQNICFNKLIRNKIQNNNSILFYSIHSFFFFFQNDIELFP